MIATTAFPEIDFNPAALYLALDIKKKAQRDQYQSYIFTNLAIAFKERILEIDLYSGTTVEQRVESRMALADEALANLVPQGLLIEAMLSWNITDQTKQTLNTYLDEILDLYKEGREIIVYTRDTLNALPFPTQVVDPTHIVGFPTHTVDPTHIVDRPIVKSNRPLVAKHKPALMTPRSVFLKKQ